MRDLQKNGDVAGILDEIRQMPALVDKLESLFDYNTVAGEYFIEDNGSVIEFGVQSADMYGDMLDNGVAKLVQGLIDGNIYEEISDMGINADDDTVLESFDSNELDEYYLTEHSLVNLCTGNPEIYESTLIENGFSDDDAKKISEQVKDYVNNVFGDGVGIFSAYDSCKETGIFNDIEETILSGLECKYLKKEDIDIGAGAFVYTIPKEDFNLLVAEAIRVSDGGDIEPTDFVCYLYQYRDAGSAYHMLTEPYYGWDGFDDKTWNAECDKFYEFLNDLFSQVGKESD